MKIKHQLRVFITLIVTIPAVALISIPVSTWIENNTSLSTHFFLYTSLFICGVFELTCILFCLHLSKTISKSITFLQKATKRLADGDVYNTLERRKNKRGENEITDLIVNLEKMRIALLEDDERRKRFIMGMSHDLRTPVAVIKGYLEAIEDGVITDEDEVKKYISNLLTKTQQLETMINSLINFVKLETVNWKENLLYQPLLPIISEFAESCINTGEVFNRNVYSNINISPDTKVLFNKELFIRAMENLFSNAQRYTKDNDSITISAAETEKEITLSIEDTGVGIAAKDIQFIFDIFYRASNSRTEPGHGIGLSVVRNIIDTHGWHIDVKSQVGVGTTFIITIPKTDSKA